MNDAMIAKIRAFSPNARLYILHVMGMDAIYGSWAVIFNLYLLAIGFSLPFIGMRILVGSLTEALASIPAGAISNLIGRQWSFILGDGVGATMAIVSILTRNSWVLLTTAVVTGLFSALHSNAEPAFMAENSRPDERIYLFSAASGFRTASATVGALVAGWVTLRFSHRVGPVTAYQDATIFGIALWFVSLVPAVLLKPSATEQEIKKVARGNSAAVWHHPTRIRRLATYAGLTSLSAGLIVPLFNVYFQRALHLNALQIGGVFAIGGVVLTIATLFAPYLESRLGTVRAVSRFRLAAVPFILGLGLLPKLLHVVPLWAPLLVFYVSRHVLSNVVHPLASAFGMNILDPGERSIATGSQTLAANVAWALAAYAGSLILHAKGYVWIFLASAVISLCAQGMYLRFFGALNPQNHAQRLDA